MESDRRSFFRTLLAPLVTLAIPKKTLAEVIDGKPETLDEISATTINYLRKQLIG